MIYQSRLKEDGDVEVTYYPDTPEEVLHTYRLMESGLIYDEEFSLVCGWLKYEGEPLRCSRGESFLRTIRRELVRISRIERRFRYAKA